MSFLKSIQIERESLWSGEGVLKGARDVQKSAARRSKGVASGQLSWSPLRHCLILEPEKLKVFVAIFIDGGLATDFAA